MEIEIDRETKTDSFDPTVCGQKVRIVCAQCCDDCTGLDMHLLWKPERRFVQEFDTVWVESAQGLHSRVSWGRLTIEYDPRFRALDGTGRRFGSCHNFALQQGILLLDSIRGVVENRGLFLGGTFCSIWAMVGKVSYS